MYYKSLLLLCLIMMMGCKESKTSDSEQNSITDALIPTENKEPVSEKHHVEWSKNAVIYEVNVRQYSKEGTFNAVTADLKRIKNLGVDVVWLMPIHPIGKLNRKGSLGSYYAVKDYKAVNPEYGTLDDFKNLVNIAHELGLKVIIDWVANHSSPDNVWVKDHIEYYSKDSLGNAPIPTIGTDWIDVADLNYDNPGLREAMQDAMIYWLKETNIDGFRCDVAEMVPLDFWVETRKKLDEVKPVFMLAEGAKEELHQAFDMTYGWPFKDLMVEISEGKKKLSDIANYITEHNKTFAVDELTMYFITNHDENSWNYIEREQFGANLKNFQALTFFMGGMPLIYSGQESGLNKKLEFFEKDPINWGTYKNTAYYQNLSKILKENEVLWNNRRAEYEILTSDDESFNFIISKDDKHLAVLQNYSSLPKYISKISLTGLNLENSLLENKDYKVSEKGLEIPPHSTVVLGQ